MQKPSSTQLNDLTLAFIVFVLCLAISFLEKSSFTIGSGMVFLP